MIRSITSPSYKAPISIDLVEEENQLAKKINDLIKGINAFVNYFNTNSVEISQKLQKETYNILFSLKIYNQLPYPQEIIDAAEKTRTKLTKRYHSALASDSSNKRTYTKKSSENSTSPVVKMIPLRNEMVGLHKNSVVSRWDSTGQLKQTYHFEKIFDIDANENYICAILREHRLGFFDLNSPQTQKGQKRHVFHFFLDVPCIRIGAIKLCGEHLLAVGCKSEKINLSQLVFYDLQKKIPIKKCEMTHQIRAIHANSTHILLGGTFHDIKLYSIEGEDLKPHTLSTERYGIYFLHIGPNNSYAIASGDKGSVLLWGNRLMFRDIIHTKFNIVKHIIKIDDNQFFLGGSYPTFYRLHRMEKKLVEYHLPGRYSSIINFMVLNGSHLMIGTESGKIFRIPLNQLELLRVPGPNEEETGINERLSITSRGAREITDKRVGKFKDKINNFTSYFTSEQISIPFNVFRQSANCLVQLEHYKEYPFSKRMVSLPKF